MRKIIRSSQFYIAIGVIALVFGLFAGCNSGCSTANKAAYVTTSTAVVTVDAAMTAWGHYVAVNHPGPESEQKVKTAFETYQRAVGTVAAAGSGYMKAKQSQSPDLPKIQVEFNAAVAGASAALSDLIVLLQSYNVKL